MEADLYAIGDTSGSKEVFEDVMKLPFREGSKKLFLGDILGDREQWGVKTVDSIYEDNSENVIVAGNHENISNALLLGMPIQNDEYITGREFLIKLYSRGVQNKVNGVLGYFNKYCEADLNSIEDFLASDNYSFERLLEIMKESDHGRKHLENLTNLKLAFQNGDHLYIHTDPTDLISEFLFQHDIDSVNNRYKEILSDIIWDGISKSVKQEYMNLVGIFLHKNNKRKQEGKNRYGLASSENIEKLSQKLGITSIIHGHSQYENCTLNIGNVVVKTIDKGCGKKTEDRDVRGMVYDQRSKRTFLEN